MKIALYYKKDKLDPNFVKEIEKKISSTGFILDSQDPEIVLFVGGDGTFLRAVHHYQNKLDSVKFVGVNKGRLGFFSGYLENEIDLLLSDLNKQKYKIQTQRLLSAKFKDKEIFALNEIRIESPFQTLISEVLINDTKLETFRGNGLAISTSLGSSAYNKSLSGAIVSPNLDAIELTEIAPINNRVYRSLHSSLVLDQNSKITLIPKTENIIIGYDELIYEDYHSEVMTLSLSNKKVSLLYKEDFNYIRHLSQTFIED